MTGLRVVVVGATGNVGTALLRALAATPAVDSVLGIARRMPDATQEPYDSAEWKSLDIADPRCEDELEEAFAGADTVVCVAWLLQPSHDEPTQRRTNVDGTRRVVAAALAAGVPHLTYASSVGTYAEGPKDREVDESWPATGVPASSYSRQKAEVEEYLDSIEARHPAMAIARVRPGLVFQRQAASEIARLFLGPFVPVRAIGRVPLPVLPLNHKLVFQCVHADDLARAFAAIVVQRAAGAFNVAADPVLGPAELAAGIRASRAVSVPISALRAVADLTWRLRIQPVSPGWLDLGAAVPIMSTARARTELGWEPEVSALDAYAELVEGFSDRAGAAASPPLRPRSEGRV